MSFIQGMFEYGALQATERAVEFASARHRVLADSIANLSTPYHKPRDLDPGAFQSVLRRATDARRRGGGANPLAGRLDMRPSSNLRFDGGPRGDALEARPTPRHENILFHDRNNRDLERIMQDLAENTIAHKAGIEMLRNQYSMLKMAIRERI